MVGFMSSLSAAMLRINPAYAAALALVVIQVSIGILFKASQTDGKYSFSASSSVTISEFLKFVLATVFFYRECAAKHATSPRLPSQGPVFDQELDEEKQVNSDDDDGEDQAFLKSAGKVASRIGQFRTAGMAMDLKTFYGYVLEEMPSESRYGFSLLALFYVLINNTVFLQYRLSDPGTIQLIKSGTTLITAVVSLTFLGTKVARGQWLAISLQVCGIVTTQYKPSGATYPFSTYMVLLFATTVSAVASVYNQKLCKGVDASMHVMNMSLYSSGAAINLLLHLITRFIKPDEPGFFTGYGQIGAILVIVSNVLIGLVMTAVYKYADAIIKCFATAMSTAILLYISPILFGVDMSFLVLPGTSVVFIATWLYMEATPPRSSTPAASEPMPMSPTERSTVGKILYMLGPGGPFKHVGLGAATAVTLIIISLLTSWDASNTKSIQDDVDAAMPQLNNTQPLIPVLESPFKNTLAYVRWNSKHEERIPLIKTGYEQFFHTMHYSMPKLMGEDGNNFVNLTHDAWEDGYWGYRAVKNTMKVILNETTEDEIGGMMFFHFDVWLDPMGFEEMDFDKIWFPDSEDPKFRCMKNTERYKEWWGWGQGFHEKSQQATRFAANMHSHYEIDTEEWCVGWSDIYYIPRRYFKEFIELSEVFLSVPVFHEVAIPTMLHIIDRTHERRPSRSIIHKIGDCWGNCCASNPTIEDIFWARCGHRLDLQNEPVSNAHFRRLRQLSLRLGSPLDEDAAQSASNSTFGATVQNGTQPQMHVKRSAKPFVPSFPFVNI